MNLHFSSFNLTAVHASNGSTFEYVWKIPIEIEKQKCCYKIFSSSHN